MTLADGKLAKERDILKAKESDQNIEAHEEARLTLHRLVSNTNRRMHKGFPEMLTYLLRKPTEYSSHEFVDVEVFQPIVEYTASLYTRLGLRDHAPVTTRAPPTDEIGSSVNIKVSPSLVGSKQKVIIT